MNRKITLILFIVLLNLGFSQTTIYSTDFANSIPTGWVVQDNLTGGNWKRTTTGGNYGGVINSTTSSNGFMIFDSDGYGNDNKPENADLISVAIDCSGKSNVVLKFQSFFRQWANSVGKVLVSNDNATWNEIYSVGSGFTQNQETDNPEIIVINISGYAANQSTVYVKFNYTGNNDYWWLIDDFEVYEPASDDIELVSINQPEVVVGTQNISIEGTVTNWGSTPITTYYIQWSDGTSAHTYTKSGVNLQLGASDNFIHDVPVTINAAESKDITVSAVLANDNNQTNNTLTTSIRSVKFVANKVVVGEEATGTWCQWCPRGHVWMEYMKQTYPDNWAGIAVHNSDPMENAAYDAAFGSLIGGYPSGSVDRRDQDVDPSDFENMYNIYKDLVPPASVFVDVTNNNGVLEITTEAQFANDYDSHPYRFNVAIVENNITGTTSGYRQANAYNGGGAGPLNGAGHDWTTAGNPVSATNMVYQDVGRELLAGFMGADESLPATISNCEKYTYDFQYTMPSGAIDSNFEVIAMLIDTTTGYIENAKLAHIGDVTISDDDDPLACKESDIKEISLLSSFNVFPNPSNSDVFITLSTTNNINLKLNAELTDLLGRVIKTNTVKNGKANFDVRDLNSGIYFVNIIENGKSIANTSVVVKK